MNTDAVATLMERLGTLLRAETRRNAAAHGLNGAQLDVLRYLGSANRYSDTLLAVVDYLGTTKGTTSQTLVALETKGLIEKQADPEDRRRVHCRVTPKGRRLLDRVCPPALVSAALAEVDGEALGGALEGVLRALQRHNGGHRFGVCMTCAHLRQEARGTRCGLTGESLREPETHLICREHSLPVVG